MATPPKLFLSFFRWFCNPKMKNHIEGDLVELYRQRVRDSGKRKADVLFMIDVLLLFRRGIIKPIQEYQHINQYSMFKNYFKVGIRNVLKYKVFSFINVFGLAVAMSICMLIILMLSDRYRYDKFNRKGDRIYRILSSTEGGRQPYATSPNPLSNILQTEYPIVELATHLQPGVGGDAVYHERTSEMRGYFAEPSLFSVFSFDLEEGDRHTALRLPNSVVITKTLARKLFQNENPIGKAIEFSDRQLSFPVRHDGIASPSVSWGSYTVTGLIDETKYLSHLRFDVLMSASTRAGLYAEKKLENKDNDWEWYFRTYTYVLLRKEKSEDDLVIALNDLVKRKYANLKAEQVKGFRLRPQVLSDIQLGLYANDTDDRMPMLGYYFLIILASVIMIMACLNYTNLSIARALTRAKEIGVRKVTGAGKSSLIFQFISESVITSMLALTMATLMLFIITPAFKSLWVNQYLEFDLPSSATVYVLFFGFALIIGIVAGIYPAFQLSKYQPIKALKNLNSVQPGKLGLRKVLSVSQFVISLLFITTSLLVYSQFKHFLEFDYGFTTKNLVNIELQGLDYRKLTTELQSLKEVSTISASDVLPATGRNNGMDIRKPNTVDEIVKMGIINTDENFVSNLGLKLLAGKSLPNDKAGSDKYVVINEEATKQLGYKETADAIGEIIETNWETPLSLEIVGVVENFRFRSPLNTHEIGPLVMRNLPDQFQYLQVKVESKNLTQTVADIESGWKKLDPIHPLKYEFYDEQLAAMNRGILDLVSVLGTIAFLAIVIACLGLLGMAIYTAERKTKEVGIRKVLGAAEMSIALLLSKEFLKVLAISIIIGAPLSYFLNNLWLQSLPNRVEFGIGTVLLAIAVLLGLGLLTIGSQTLKAARNNPIDALRSE